MSRVPEPALLDSGPLDPEALGAGPPSRGPAWVQANLTLHRGSDGVPVVPWVGLADAAAGWEAAGLVRSAFFVRKPPGLRLRLAPRWDAGEVEVDVAAWSEEARRRGEIASWCIVPYEPEVTRFGGPAGMALAHERFASVSRLALAAEAAGDGAAAPFLLAQATDHLAHRCVGDGAEVLDVWARIAAYLDANGIEAGGTNASSPIGAEPTEVHVHEATASAWARLQGDNERLAERLGAMAAAGRIAIGTREWLARTTIFAANQLGVFAPALRAATDAALAPLEA